MEELLDSTGVLFRLPTADMLSMVACRGQIEEADGRDPGEIDSGDGKSETKPFRPNVSSDVNAPPPIEMDPEKWLLFLGRFINPGH